MDYINSNQSATQDLSYKENKISNLIPTALFGCEEKIKEKKYKEIK